MSIEASDGDRFVGRLDWNGDERLDLIQVHLDYRRRGIAKFNHVKRHHIEPNLHHLLEMTDEGRAWALSMGWTTKTWTRRQRRAFKSRSKESSRGGQGRVGEAIEREAI